MYTNVVKFDPCTPLHLVLPDTSRLRCAAPYILETEPASATIVEATATTAADGDFLSPHRALMTRGNGTPSPTAAAGYTASPTGTRSGGRGGSSDDQDDDITFLVSVSPTPSGVTAGPTASPTGSSRDGGGGGGRGGGGGGGGRGGGGGGGGGRGEEGPGDDAEDGALFSDTRDTSGASLVDHDGGRGSTTILLVVLTAFAIAVALLLYRRWRKRRSGWSRLDIGATLLP